MNCIKLTEIDSTNSYLERNAHELPSPTLVTCGRQTAGRGQRGNSWESEPGKNLTFSMLLRPDLLPAQQFYISEAVALSICDSLGEMCGVECRVKWPNDIYAGDRKICGILISHSLSGSRINHTVAGAGVNVNQDRFFSGAPNPVSVRQITGREYPLDELLEDMAARIAARVAALSSADADALASLHREYRNRLWRGDGKLYRFRDLRANPSAQTYFADPAQAPQGRDFLARVLDVETSGHLILKPAESEEKLRFAFKEVAWL